MKGLACALLLLLPGAQATERPGDAAGAPAAGDPAAGARLFASRCASCHSVGPGARSGFGPQLNGLFGRKAGSLPDYAYSKAMKSVRLAWDERTLRAFLADPDEVVPDTKMRFWGMGNARQVNDLLAHLARFQHVGTVLPGSAPETGRRKDAAGR